jgi:excisionase family DNA binding protein
MKKAKHEEQIDPIAMVYNLRQAANALGVCLTTLRREIDLGHLRSFRIGRRRVVSPQALAEYVAKKDRAAK